MNIRVELYGIARQRAGTDQVVVKTPLEPARLGDVIGELAARFPRLAEGCFDGDRLRAGYVASVDGDRFVTDPDTPLRSGEALLILSADAGG